MDIVAQQVKPPLATLMVWKKAAAVGPSFWVSDTHMGDTDEFSGCPGPVLASVTIQERMGNILFVSPFFPLPFLTSSSPSSVSLSLFPSLEPFQRNK